MIFDFGDFSGGKYSKNHSKKTKKTYVVVQLFSNFARICCKRCVLTMRKTCTRWIFDFWVWGISGGKKSKNHPKKPKTLAQHLQFLTDFARVYFKMYVLIVCNIWRNRFFNLGFFLGVKNCEKTPEIPKISFLCFSADFDEIWYKMFFWSPKTKSEVKFSKFWKGGPSGEGWGGRVGDPQKFPKTYSSSNFDRNW